MFNFVKDRKPRENILHVGVSKVKNYKDSTIIFFGHIVQFWRNVIFYDAIQHPVNFHSITVCIWEIKRMSNKTAQMFLFDGTNTAQMRQTGCNLDFDGVLSDITGHKMQFLKNSLSDSLAVGTLHEWIIDFNSFSNSRSCTDWLGKSCFTCFSYVELQFVKSEWNPKHCRKHQCYCVQDVPHNLSLTV